MTLIARGIRVDTCPTGCPVVVLIDRAGGWRYLFDELVD